MGIPEQGTFQVMANGFPQARRKNLANPRKLRSVGLMAFSPDEKLELIVASFHAEVSVADGCRRAQVPESTFRDWRARFLAAGMGALQPTNPTQGGDAVARWPSALDRLTRDPTGRRPLRDPTPRGGFVWCAFRPWSDFRASLI